eukprot:jgi/Tetstr1/420807/TSEL_011883.t1
MASLRRPGAIQPGATSPLPLLPTGAPRHRHRHRHRRWRRISRMIPATALGGDEEGDEDEYEEVEDDGWWWRRGEAVAEEHVEVGAADVAEAAAQRDTSGDTYQVMAVPLPLPTWQPTSFAEGVSGWAVAMALLLAGRLSRWDAQGRQRLPSETDWKLQQGRRRSVSANPEMLLRQREYDAKHAEERQSRAAQSMQEAKQREEAQRRARQEREARMREEAERETERLRVEREAQREAYQEKEVAMAAELEERTAKERAIREEAAAKRRAELEAKRRKEEEAARVAAEAKAAAEAARLAELEEARRAAREEAAKLRKMSKKFALGMDATVTVAPAQKGAVTEGPLERAAVVQITAGCTSALGGPGDTYEMLFASLDDAKRGAAGVVGMAARSAADAYISAVRLQQMMGQGALQSMDDLELQHWMRQAVYRVESKGADKLEAMLTKFSSRRQQLVEEELSVRTPRLVLPVDNPKSCRALLEEAAAKIENDQMGDIGSGDADDASASGPSGATKILLQLMKKEEDEIAGDGVQPPRHGAEALLLAHFLDRVLDLRPSKTSDAPAWFEAAAALSRRLLAHSCQGAAEDSLSPVAQAVMHALPDSHPITNALLELEQRNLSALTRAMMEEKQRIIQAELQERLLKEEWPDREELAAARMEEIEANTPVPERCWALRNVAGTLTMGGPGERQRALTMLERALALKEQYYKSQLHPGLLAELEMLASLLERDHLLWAAAAKANKLRILEVVRLVAARYRLDGDPLGAAVLQAGAAAECAEFLGPSNQLASAMAAEARGWLKELGPEAVKQASKQLAATEGRVIKQLAIDFTENLGVYKQGRKGRAELWVAP